MAHSAHASAKLEKLLHNAVGMKLPELAQQHLIMGEELLETEDYAAALTTRALIAAVDAIGKVRFPQEWETARDNAGANQDAN